MSRRARAFALCAAILASRCRGGERPAAAPGPTPRPIAERILPPPGFAPPADGILTPDQVDMFLRVRRAAKGRTDTEAARALGVEVDEMAWARSRIVEALVALDDRRVRDASSEVYGRSLAALRDARQKTTDPARARTLDEQIAVLERERAGIRRSETPSPSLAANMKRVSSRRAEIEALAP